MEHNARGEDRAFRVPIHRSSRLRYRPGDYKNETQNILAAVAKKLNAPEVLELVKRIAELRG